MALASRRSRRQPKSRARDLGKALSAIEEKFGVGALQRLGDLPNTSVDALSTGIDDLDSALGIGGWPRGRICEVFGPEGEGVTTLLLQSLAAAQQRGGIVAFVDADHAFAPEYARRLSCAVEDIFIAQPDDGPMALESVDALVRCRAFDVVALDSVPALHSSQCDDREVTTQDETLTHARLLSEAMRRLSANIDRTKTVMLFGNRVSDHSGDDAEGTTPGGRALRFYSSMRLSLQRGAMLRDSMGGVAGMQITATMAKNKVAPPLRHAQLVLMYGQGFS